MMSLNPRHLILMGILCSTALIFMGAKTPVTSEQLQEVQVQINGETWTAWCLNSVAGKRKEKKDFSLFFIPYSDLVIKFRKKKKKAKQANDTSLKKKLGKKQKIHKNLLKAATPVCEGLGNINDPEQDQDSGDGTDDESDNNPQDTYFFANGNVTPLGKVVFEIPSTLTANAFVGEALFQNTCLDCHQKRARPTMPLLRQAISPAPMSYTEELFSNQDLADLTAYLQIGRSPLLEEHL